VQEVFSAPSRPLSRLKSDAAVRTECLNVVSYGDDTGAQKIEKKRVVVWIAGAGGTALLVPQRYST